MVYTHKCSKAIEYMLADAFRLADPVLHLSERLRDPASFCGLTDGVLRDIEFSRNSQLQPARNIVINIRRRKLYKMAVEALLLEPLDPNLDVLQLVRCSNGALSEDDVIVQHYTLDYAMGAANPVDNVHFFTDWSSSTAISIDRRAVSLLIPDRFEEHYLRVFCRDRSKVHLALEAFTRWQHATNLRFLHPLSSPNKRK